MISDPPPLAALEQRRTLAGVTTPSRPTRPSTSKGPLQVLYLAPFACAAAGLAVSLGRAPDEVSLLVRESGAAAFGVGVVAFLAAVGASVCVGLGAWRPFALVAGVAPWFAANVGSNANAMEVFSVVPHASPAHYPTLMAAGAAEVLAARVLGSAASVAIFAGLVVAFLVRARGDGRSSVAAAFMALAGMGLALASVMEAIPLRAALAALGGAHGVSAPLEVAVAAAARADAAPLLGQAIAGAATLGALAVALLARASRGAALTGVAACALALPTGALGDWFVSRRLATTPLHDVQPLWVRDQAGFAPVVVTHLDERADPPGDVDVTLLPTGAQPDLAAVLRTGDDGLGGTFEARHGGPLRVAMDERATADSVRTLVNEARAARVGRAVLVVREPPPPVMAHPLVAKHAKAPWRSLTAEVTPLEGASCASTWRVGAAWALDGGVEGDTLVVPVTSLPPPVKRAKPTPGKQACLSLEGDVSATALHTAIVNLHAIGEASVSLGERAPVEGFGTVGELSNRERDRAEAMAALAQLGLRGPDGPVMDPSGAPIILGSLDKETIRRVIMAKAALVRACYERGLLADPSLAGRITVKLVINARGNVTQAQIVETALAGNAAKKTEQCVVDVVKTLVFPQPPGGGIVIVSYPFVFRPAN